MKKIYTEIHLTHRIPNKATTCFQLPHTYMHKHSPLPHMVKSGKGISIVFALDQLVGLWEIICFWKQKKNE